MCITSVLYFYILQVRQNLLTRQKIIEKKEKLRKLREQKKFGKKVLYLQLPS